MRLLTLGDLQLGLADLLGKRRVDLVRSRSGQFHLPELEEKKQTIDALPPALVGAPLADALATTDNLHDGLGAFLYFYTEAERRLPGISPTLLGAAERIRAALIPALDELGAPYSVEAEKARERKPQLEALRADLERFPVAERGSLYEVAHAYVAAGEELARLLSERADLTAPSRGAAGQLRGATIGLLGRLRADLAKELRRDPSLPRDLDERVFGFIDLLVAQAAARNASKGGGGTGGGGAPTE